ncbi:LOW QUALITY PROTEIN: galactosylceramide sulfotransferase [Xyrauchen texanus]|uniref:LOW QUALITY PROTEIN: galactosylceramide sulfotransferase n=1 Tax=Xyrauchen texanus TaxID=154827 RepID=UPI0022425F0C|nr:LOW QUALITY PROTEIN: galactosylceramide sulfotransferase [Xyrauchen texanus]
MTLRWLSSQLWRHRVSGLLAVLVVLLLLTLLATQSLQINRTHELRPTEERRNHRETAHRHTNLHTQNTHQTPKQTSPTSDDQQRALPPVVFLKTHRTGSSTVQNILFRLGERESATFAFPYHTYQFNYPDRFKAAFVDELPEGSSQFNLLCSNMRLDLTQVKQVMPPNTVFITLLRDPVRTFESVFSYYTSTIPAFLSAYRATANTANGGKSALSVFLDSPERFWDPNEPGNGLAKNPMSFDMGLNNQKWNTSWPEDLSQLEEAFHLVMIAEHFDESLVLLGALLGLDHEDLAYVRLNSRTSNSVTELDKNMMAKLRSWNVLDTLLYEFFVQVFWEKASQFGLERLKVEVAKLRASTESVRQKCVSRAAVPPAELEDLLRPWQTESVTIVGYEVQGKLSLQDQGFCVRLMLPELQYHSHLYFRQYGRDMRAAPAD